MELIAQFASHAYCVIGNTIGSFLTSANETFLKNVNNLAASSESQLAQTPTALASLDEECMTADQLQCRAALRTGKSLLNEKNGSAAMVRFEKALMLSKGLSDKIQERRAMRGLAAAARLQVLLITLLNQSSTAWQLVDCEY